MSEILTAISLDLDGVIFWRIPIQLEVLKPWGYGKLLVPRKNPITRADRVMEDRVLTRREQRELARHEHRKVFTERIPLIKKMQADIVIGSTGRPNHHGMVSTTIRGLSEAGIYKRFGYINFTPPGVSSDESKYWSLYELHEDGYTDIFHYEDNARTVRRLAPLLPYVHFVIVQDLTTGILFSRSEMKKYKNVARIAIDRKGSVDVVSLPGTFGPLPHSIT